MHGPMPARIRSRCAPRRSIASTVASTTPPKAPRQPACAAPITRAAGSREQHRRAVGSEHAQRQAGDVGRHRVRPRRILDFPGLFDGNSDGAVDLVAGREPVGRNTEQRHRDVAVARDLCREVARAEPAIQRGVEAVADPALPGEKGMADAGASSRLARRIIASAKPRRHRQTRRGQRHNFEQGAHMRRVEQAFETALQAAAAVPAPPARTEPSSRRTAASRCRNAPCGTGPCTAAPAATAASAKAAKSTSALRSALPGASSAPTGWWCRTARRLAPAALGKRP